MRAGMTRYEVETRIRITSVPSNWAADQQLIGRTGRLTHPFGDCPGAILGVWLDPIPNDPVYDSRVGLTAGDQFEIID